MENVKEKREIERAIALLVELERDGRLARDQVMVAAAGMASQALRWASGDPSSAFDKLLERLQRVRGIGLN